MNTAVVRPKIGKSPFASTAPIREPKFNEGQLNLLVWVLPVLAFAIVVALLIRPESPTFPAAEANLTVPPLAILEVPPSDQANGVKIIAQNSQGALVGQMTNVQPTAPVDSYSMQPQAAIDSNDTNQLLSIISKH